MPVKYITDWRSKKFTEIIDVRSPKEYYEDHIPKSINLPVLNDSERSLIGSIYKKDSPFKAKKLGASIISKNISKFIKNEFLYKAGDWKPLIYCWRGGQRSKSLAIILSEIGWEVFVVKDGYKRYRNYINQNLNKLTNIFKFIVLRGATGTGKTKILSRLEKIGCPALNLEVLANHKGSLLGKNAASPQPSQKLFESLIYSKLNEFDKKYPVIVESESSKIGNLYLPSQMIKKIKISPCIDLEANIKARADFLVKDYSEFILNKNNFKDFFRHTRKKLGNKIVSKWSQNYRKSNWNELALQLINEYYDPLYKHKKNEKENNILEIYKLNKINTSSINKISDYLKEKYFKVSSKL